MQTTNNYRVLSGGTTREALRKKGQFWTPDWIADAMVEFVIAEGRNRIFDPSVGAGVFLRSAKRVASEQGRTIQMAGIEIDPSAIEQAKLDGLTEMDLENVVIGDFLLDDIGEKYPAIVANPPYIRHHRLSPPMKQLLREMVLRQTGILIDGRTGLHVYFLLRALAKLEDNGCLAFIVPADTFEGRSSTPVWTWIAERYRLEAVLTFTPHTSPFPGIDTNPVIVFIRNALPTPEFVWGRHHTQHFGYLRTWVNGGFPVGDAQGVSASYRMVVEGVTTGLSRSPIPQQLSRYFLGDFVRIVRGVATGANDYFFMNSAQKLSTGIPDRYFVRAVGRTRDVPADVITPDLLKSLDDSGRPTYLLALTGNEEDEGLPESVKQYLSQGESIGLHQRPLISQRRPWFKMESRLAPPFLFAYLGRRSTRFIRNAASVIPLTCFLCVYPKWNDELFIERLWKLLSDQSVALHLATIAKSYGNGALKVEPRALERLPIPEPLIEKSGLSLQLRLLEGGPDYET